MKKLTCHKFLKLIIACIWYCILILIGYWAGGNGIKDEWDKLILWVNKSKTSSD